VDGPVGMHDHMDSDRRKMTPGVSLTQRRLKTVIIKAPHGVQIGAQDAMTRPSG
jgi:hypothetical protein